MDITPLDSPGGALAVFGVLAGPLIGKEVPVRSPVSAIGRAPRNDLVIDDDSVSAEHARLEWDQGGWRLTDLDSVNGTFVESVKLAPQVPTPIPYGASVRLGGVRLQFRAVEAADPETAREAYVPPERKPSLREERSGFRFPVWALVLLVLLVAAIVAGILFRDQLLPAPVDPPTREAPASAALLLPPFTGA